MQISFFKERVYQYMYVCIYVCKKNKLITSHCEREGRITREKAKEERAGFMCFVAHCVFFQYKYNLNSHVRLDVSIWTSVRFLTKSQMTFS